MMKSWKSRLLLVFTMLAVVLVLSVPATAEDVDLKVQCEADHGYCKKQVSQEVWHKATDEDTGSDPQEDGLANPMDPSLANPVDPSLANPADPSLANPVDEVSDKPPVDEISDEESSFPKFPGSDIVSSKLWWPY